MYIMKDQMLWGSNTLIGDIGGYSTKGSEELTGAITSI